MRISDWSSDVCSSDLKYAKLSDRKLQAQTDELKKRLKDESLDTILPDAFALVRETAKRVLGMRHFDVQLIGGMVLHEGSVSEMKTGEGRTEERSVGKECVSKRGSRWAGDY